MFFVDKMHILSRLDINLKYDSGGITVDGKEVADSLTDNIFIPVLERVIDEYPEEDDIYIDSIEVQVPPVSEEELPEAFESALREALSLAIASKYYAVPGTLPAATAREEIQRLKLLLAEDDTIPGGIPAQSTFEELLSLLSSLTMPRISADEVSPASGVVTSPDASPGISPGRTPGNTIEGISEIIPGQEQTVGKEGPSLSGGESGGHGQRIPDVPDITSGNFDTRFITGLTQTEKIRLLVFIEQGRASAASGASAEKFPEEAAVRLSAALRESIAAQDARALSSLDGRLASWRQYLSARKEAPEKPSPSAEDIIFVEDTEPAEPSRYGELSAPTVETAVLPPEEALTTEESLPEPHQTEAAEEKATQPPEEEYWQSLENEQPAPDSRHFVNDAGLTLLHPFILPFLQNMGLVKKGKFLSPEARIYAVHLLKELAYPGCPHFNHNLTLEKILCGLPPEFTIPEEWEPDDKVKEESEALLKAVCGHWEPLSNSSATALRNGFLQRGGSVEMDQDTWIVRVEGSAMDILLDQLPWELSFIILPWYEMPILVEWQQESF